jgi:hypothetical protein
MDNADHSTDGTRRAYASPTIFRLGNVAQLTAAGSGAGSEHAGNSNNSSCKNTPSRCVR